MNVKRKGIKMNEYKSSLRLLKKMIMNIGSFTTALFGICFIGFGIIMICFSAFLGEQTGNEKYFLSIAVVCMGMTFIYLFGYLSSANFNSRFFYSCPQSETIITKLIPRISLICAVSISAFSIILTTISITIGITDGNRISDLMLCLSFTAFVCQLASGSVGTKKLILLTYLGILPFFIVSLINDTQNPTLAHIFTTGFSIPVHISAIVLLASIVISFFISLKLARRTYANRSAKTMYISQSTAV